MSTATWQSTVSNRMNLALDTALVASGKCCLLKIHPAAGAGAVAPLSEQALVIGRDADCDMQVPDESLSRRHAQIESRDGRVTLTDLGSASGVYVNGVRASRAVLQAGDRIRLGNHIFKFLSAENFEAQYQEAAFQMMTSDALTGAYNKRYLLDVLGRELPCSQRHGRPLSLLMIDIDHFKKINDLHGHLTGDEVLAELSRRCGVGLRREEVLARYGGEEFAVVLPGTTLEAARQVAERLRAAIASEPFSTEEATIEVTASIGIAETRGEDHLSPMHLAQQADQKLYEAKRSGRNRVCG